MDTIKFGTDGWRAIVGKDFIPKNIERVIQAFADLYPDLPDTGKPVVIGYDRRNQSPEAAKQVAQILLGNNITTVLSNTYCPTPTVSWHTRHKNYAAGIVITASHNPSNWNGIKFKESYGGAASADYCRPIEEKIIENDEANRPAQYAELDNNPLLSYFDPYDEYMKSFHQFIDMEKIKNSGFKVMFDPLFGAGTSYMTRLLGDMVTEIHTEADITFAGLNPEPIPPNANELMERVKIGNFACGLLTDGDADRAGACDEHGNFVTTHEVYALLIRHAIENKKWSGKIIKSISTTQMLNRIAKKYNMPLDTTPVGFKYISPAMKEDGVMIGGEESGGFGFPEHIPERDGVFSDLLLLELMATRNMTLGQLVEELQNEFGPCKYRRIDNHLSADEIATAREKMATLDIKSVGNKTVIKHETMDGHHFLFNNDSWLLFRASGTEPLIRVYAEASSNDEVEELLSAGMKAIGLK